MAHNTRNNACSLTMRLSPNVCLAYLHIPAPGPDHLHHPVIGCDLEYFSQAGFDMEKNHAQAASTKAWTKSQTSSMMLIHPHFMIDTFIHTCMYVSTPPGSAAGTPLLATQSTPPASIIATSSANSTLSPQQVTHPVHQPHQVTRPPRPCQFNPHLCPRP